MNVFYLKLVALFTMIIDHVGLVFFPKFLIFRYIGRLAFPIYSFLVSEGLKKTSNLHKYLIRLLSFAIISEVFFDLAFYEKAFYFQYNNTIFTLFFSSLIIFIINNINLNFLLKCIFSTLILVLVYFLKVDYGIWGIFLTLSFYFSKTKLEKIFFPAFFIITKGLNFIYTIFTLISLIFIYFYNENKGRDIKFFNISFFYWAYPLHFFIIYIIKILNKS